MIVFFVKQIFGATGPIAQERSGCGDSWAGYGDISGIGIDTLWILTPTDGQPASEGNGTNVALVEPIREAVDIIHKVAIEYGGTSEGVPGIRSENHPNFYAATFVT